MTCRAPLALGTIMAADVCRFGDGVGDCREESKCLALRSKEGGLLGAGSTLAESSPPEQGEM